MTINDLQQSASATGVTMTFFIVMMIIVMAWIIFMAYFPRSGRDARRTKKILVGSGVAVAILTVGGLITMANVTGDLREKEEAATAANARTLQGWAEQEYGITISDDTASKVMDWWGSGRTFEAETADGAVELKLKATDDGSFRLVQTGNILEPVDSQ